MLPTTYQRLQDDSTKYFHKSIYFPSFSPFYGGHPLECPAFFGKISKSKFFTSSPPVFFDGSWCSLGWGRRVFDGWSWGRLFGEYWWGLLGVSGCGITHFHEPQWFMVLKGGQWWLIGIPPVNQMWLGNPRTKLGSLYIAEKISWISGGLSSKPWLPDGSYQKDAYFFGVCCTYHSSPLGSSSKGPLLEQAGGLLKIPAN